MPRKGLHLVARDWDCIDRRRQPIMSNQWYVGETKSITDGEPMKQRISTASRRRRSKVEDPINSKVHDKRKTSWYKRWIGEKME